MAYEHATLGNRDARRTLDDGMRLIRKKLRRLEERREQLAQEPNPVKRRSAEVQITEELAELKASAAAVGVALESLQRASN